MCLTSAVRGAGHPAPPASMSRAGECRSREERLGTVPGQRLGAVERRSDGGALLAARRALRPSVLLAQVGDQVRAEIALGSVRGARGRSVCPSTRTACTPRVLEGGPDRAVVGARRASRAPTPGNAATAGPLPALAGSSMALIHLPRSRLGAFPDGRVVAARGRHGTVTAIEAFTYGARAATQRLCWSFNQRGCRVLLLHEWRSALTVEVTQKRSTLTLCVRDPSRTGARGARASPVRSKRR